HAIDRDLLDQQLVGDLLIVLVGLVGDGGLLQIHGPSVSAARSGDPCQASVGRGSGSPTAGSSSWCTTESSARRRSGPVSSGSRSGSTCTDSASIRSRIGRPSRSVTWASAA